MSSHNVWMIKTIWLAWLIKCDYQWRKNVLVVNCSAHGEVDSLINIEIVNLPSNTTSIKPPCYMRIIRTIQSYCRHEIRSRIFTTTIITRRQKVLNVLHILAGDWVQVSKERIRLRSSMTKEVEMENEDDSSVPRDMTAKEFSAWAE